jgi:hypothetical protein
MPRTQARAIQLIVFIDASVTVEQDSECAADFVHPLLEGGECSERNDEDAGIELGKFFLVSAQLCGMFAAGYSAEVTEKDKQDVVGRLDQLGQRDGRPIYGAQREPRSQLPDLE